jgi:hypothetical protein
MLHLTNGDVVGDALSESELPGAVLPWRDVLPNGPVPGGLSLSALSEVRVRFLADCGWADFGNAASEFARRDGVLAGSADEDEIVLWFEWDLYDQLQLSQILAWLADQEERAAELSLVDYAGYLGDLTASELVALFPERRPVTSEQLQLARRAGSAFRSSDPTEIEEVIGSDTRPLPHVAAAFRRHLKEFPDVVAGLSRTERQILESAAEAPRTREELFQAQQDREERLFMGDRSFCVHVDRLAAGPEPLLAENDGRVRVTQAGIDVLAGQADNVRLNGVDRWLGGVHLEDGSAAWRWDGTEGRLRAADPV